MTNSGYFPLVCAPSCRDQGSGHVHTNQNLDYPGQAMPLCIVVAQKQCNMGIYTLSNITALDIFNFERKGKTHEKFTEIICVCSCHVLNERVHNVSAWAPTGSGEYILLKGDGARHEPGSLQKTSLHLGLESCKWESSTTCNYYLHWTKTNCALYVLSKNV